MTKQEEIREGIAKKLAFYTCEYDWDNMAPFRKQVYRDQALAILEYEDSQDVVLDKQQSFPTIQIHGVIIQPEELERLLPNFKAVEPLIENNRLPQFASEDEERDFWATHDSTDYADTASPVVLKYEPLIKEE